MFKHDGTRMPFDGMYQVPYYGQFCMYDHLLRNHPLYRIQEKQTFTNEDGVLTSQLLDFSFFNIQGVKGYYKIEADGYRIRLVSAEDIARGAGLVKVENRTRTSARTNEQLEYAYDSIQWNRFNQYAEESLKYIDLSRECKYFKVPFDRESYLPLKLAIMVISRCASEQARKFQGIVATVIADEIDRLIDDKYDRLIDDMQTTIDYQNAYLNTEGLFSSTQIAKDFNMTAQKMHKVLHIKGYIYRANGQWVVRSNYDRLSPTKSIDIDTPTGKQTVTFWTESGRHMIYSMLLTEGFKFNQDNDELINIITKK